MQNFKRLTVAVASAGLVTMGVPMAANAAPADSGAMSTESAATCYVQPRKPWIVGGTGRTAAGSGTAWCQGGQVRMRLDVTLQKQVNGRWVNQRPSTYCVAYFGSVRKTCTERNGASSGLWRTWVKAHILPNGQTRSFYSGTTRFVPAKVGGLTA